ncbi:caspase family protein [Candidatus Acetothermia bacterium]|nr:caspase family protein [Candidatus Acetothermia bacterium]
MTSNTPSREQMRIMQLLGLQKLLAGLIGIVLISGGYFIGGVRMLVCRFNSQRLRISSATAIKTVLLMLFALFVLTSDFIREPGKLYAQGAAYRALLLYGDKDLGMQEDAEHLREALLQGTNWPAANVLPAEQAPNIAADLKARVTAACGANGPGDICLFYYAGHGWKVKDDEGDDADTNDDPKADPHHSCKLTQVATKEVQRKQVPPGSR